MSRKALTAGQRRILLVDDDEHILIALKLLLSPFFEVEEAANGTSAEDSFTKGNFDVAFVDYTLPDMTGLDLLRRIRDANPLVRRVLTSGRLPHEVFPLAHDGLLHAFVVKPASIEEIVLACGGAVAEFRRLTL